MLKINTNLTYDAAIELMYHHAIDDHGREWTGQLVLICPATKHIEASYAVVCHTCNPPQEKLAGQTNPNPTTPIRIIPGITQNRKELDR